MSANFQSVSQEYDRMYVAQKIDYDKITSGILEAARQEFPELTEQQLGLIWSKVYEENHSYFGECIWGMHSLCEFSANLLKTKA